jgi:hypothetical protein
MASARCSSVGPDPVPVDRLGDRAPGGVAYEPRDVLDGTPGSDNTKLCRSSRRDTRLPVSTAEEVADMVNGAYAVRVPDATREGGAQSRTATAELSHIKTRRRLWHHCLGRSARPQPCRPGRRGSGHTRRYDDQHGSHGYADRYCTLPSSSPPRYPARVRHVKGAPAAPRCSIGIRRP